MHLKQFAVLLAIYLLLAVPASSSDSRSRRSNGSNGPPLPENGRARVPGNVMAPIGADELRPAVWPPRLTAAQRRQANAVDARIFVCLSLFFTVICYFGDLWFKYQYPEAIGRITSVFEVGLPLFLFLDFILSFHWIGAELDNLLCRTDER